jgi:hypothetical protein
MIIPEEVIMRKILIVMGCKSNDQQRFGSALRMDTRRFHKQVKLNITIIMLLDQQLL